MKKAKKKTARKATSKSAKRKAINAFLTSISTNPDLGRRLRKEAKAVARKGRVIFGASLITPAILAEQDRRNAKRTQFINSFSATDFFVKPSPRTLGVEGGWTHDLIQAEAHRDLTAMGRTFVTPGFLSGRSSRFTSRPNF